MAAFERHDVDDDVGTVRDLEGAGVLAVELHSADSDELFRQVAAPARDSDLPAGVAESASNRTAHISRAADDERLRALLLDADRVADADVTVVQDVGVQAAAVREPFDDARLCERLQVRAGFAELDSAALHITDAETLADEAVDIDTAREHVSSRCRSLEALLRLAFERFECLGSDQRQRATLRCAAVRTARGMPSALGDDRKTCRLEHAELANDTVATAVSAVAAGGQTQPVALDTQRVLELERLDRCRKRVRHRNVHAARTVSGGAGAPAAADPFVVRGLVGSD